MCDSGRQYSDEEDVGELSFISPTFFFQLKFFFRGLLSLSKDKKKESRSQIYSPGYPFVNRTGACDYSLVGQPGTTRVTQSPFWLRLIQCLSDHRHREPARGELVL